MLPASSRPIDPSDERQLALALREGRPEAARQLVQRYQALLLRVCMRLLRNRHDAEDVVQESLLRAIRGIGGFDPSKPLRPWLVGITVNRCRTWRSRARNRACAALLPESYPDARSGLKDPDDLAGDLDDCLRRLRPEYRNVFVLFHDQGLPYEEIAQALDRPVGTIKIWLHRARAQLADALAACGHGPPERAVRSRGGEA